MLVTQSNYELVGTGEFPRSKAIIILPADPRRSAFLTIEESAFCGFKLYTIRIVALCRYVCVEALVTELRGQQTGVADEVAVLRR